MAAIPGGARHYIVLAALLFSGWWLAQQGVSHATVGILVLTVGAVAWDSYNCGRERCDD